MRKTQGNQLIEDGKNEQPKTDLIVELIGEDGNIFNLTSIVTRELKRHGYREYAKELQERLFEQESYNDALNLISEYVEIN